MLPRTILRRTLASRLVASVIGCGVIAGSAAAAQAGGKDFAIVTMRLGGDAESAQPYINKFAAHLEAQTGWPKGSAKGSFLGSKKEALAYIESQKPGFGVFEPWLYFELEKSHKLEPIAQVVSSDLNSPRYHVVVKDAAVKGLDDLKGKRLWTTIADAPRYLGNVVLDGKGPAETRFTLKQIGSAMKGARAVLRGEAEATLLDDEQLEAAKKLEGGAALRTIYSSPQLPSVLVVTFGTNIQPADGQALAKNVGTLCEQKGGEICKEMHISKFVPVDQALLSAARKRFAKP